MSLLPLCHFQPDILSDSDHCVEILTYWGFRLGASLSARRDPHRGPFPLCVLSQVTYPSPDTQLLVNFLCLCPQPTHVRIAYQILKSDCGRVMLIVWHSNRRPRTQSRNSLIVLFINCSVVVVDPKRYHLLPKLFRVKAINKKCLIVAQLTKWVVTVRNLCCRCFQYHATLTRHSDICTGRIRARPQDHGSCHILVFGSRIVPVCCLSCFFADAKVLIHLGCCPSNLIVYVHCCLLHPVHADGSYKYLLQKGDKLWECDLSWDVYMVGWCMI